MPEVFMSSPSGQYGEKSVSPPPLTEGAPWWRCICQTHCAGPWRNIWFLPQRSYTIRTNIITLQPKAIPIFLPKHTRTSLQHDQEGKLFFWHQTVLCSCPQTGRYTEPVIFILHREFSLFMALIPTWSLESYLPQLYILLIASSTS